MEQLERESHTAPQAPVAVNWLPPIDKETSFPLLSKLTSAPENPLLSITKLSRSDKEDRSGRMPVKFALPTLSTLKLGHPSSGGRLPEALMFKAKKTSREGSEKTGREPDSRVL